MAEVLSPFVFWGQNNEKIFLKVDLKDVTNPGVKLDEDTLNFQANGQGVKGRNDYTFELEFYLPIDPDRSEFRASPRHIEFQIRKQGVGECWPRLTVEQKKPAWLKIDFDHFGDDEDDSEAAIDEQQFDAREADLMRDLERKMEEEDSFVMPDMKTIWLFFYNMFQWVGFSYIWGSLCYYYWNYGEASKEDAYQNVGGQLMVCQLAAIFEVIHPMLGFVKGGFLAPFMQVFGRNMVLFVLVAAEPKLQNSQVTWWLILFWAAVEIIRYPFYILSALSWDWRIITWLRYTMWIPLYPLGFGMEVFTILSAIPLFEASGKWSAELPNSINMAFPFPLFLRVYLVVALLGFSSLLRRMYSQRKKRLGSGRKASQKAKAA